MIKKEDFFQKLLEVLDLDEIEENLTINEDTLLDEIDFDSIGKLGVLALIDTYSEKSINVEDLLKCERIKDILDLAGCN